MTTDSRTAPPARLPMLLGALASSCVLAVPAGFFGAALFGESDAGLSASESATAGALPVAIGAAIGVLVIVPAGMRLPSRLRVSLCIGAVPAFAAGTAAAALVFLTLRPQAMAYWCSVLTGLVLCLAATGAWVRSVRRGADTRTMA